MLDFLLVFSVWTLVSVAFINVAFNSDLMPQLERPINNNRYLNFFYSIASILWCSYGIFVDFNLKWYYFFVIIIVIHLIISNIGGFLFSRHKKMYMSIGGFFVPNDLRFFLKDDGIYSRIMFFFGFIGILATIIW